MNTLSNLVSSVDKKANSYLSFLDNKYVRTSILTFLAIYIAVWSPRLPKSMNYLFKNNVFRMVIFTLALFVSTKDLGVSLMIALAFLVSMITLRKYNLMDIASSVEDKELENSEELLNENELDDTNSYDSNRRNNKIIHYENGVLDYENDTVTLDNHIQNPNGDESPGFLNNVENNGIKSTSGNNEVIDLEQERRNSVENKEDYEDYRELVVGAPLHMNEEHLSAQGLQRVGGMEGKNIGSWFEH